MDWKSIVKVVAPTIATGLGGPLAGLATKALSEVLLGRPDGTEDEVAQAVLGANPDQLLAIKQADQEFAKEMKRLDIDLEKTYVADTSDAPARLRRKQGRVLARHCRAGHLRRRHVWRAVG